MRRRRAFGSPAILALRPASTDHDPYRAVQTRQGGDGGRVRATAGGHRAAAALAEAPARPSRLRGGRRKGGQRRPIASAPGATPAVVAGRDACASSCPTAFCQAPFARVGAAADVEQLRSNFTSLFSTAPPRPPRNTLDLGVATASSAPCGVSAVYITNRNIIVGHKLGLSGLARSSPGWCCLWRCHRPTLAALRSLRTLSSVLAYSPGVPVGYAQSERRSDRSRRVEDAGRHPRRPASIRASAGAAARSGIIAAWCLSHRLIREVGLDHLFTRHQGCRRDLDLKEEGRSAPSPSSYRRWCLPLPRSLRASVAAARPRVRIDFPA